MSEGRTADEWLIRYLVIGVVGATAALAVIYGLSLGESVTAAGVGAVGLLVVSLVVARDLGRFRTTEQ